MTNDDDYRLQRALRGADPQITQRLSTALPALARNYDGGERAEAIVAYRRHVKPVPGAHRAAQALVRMARLSGHGRLARSMSAIVRHA
jgi:hypothetical protein